MHWKQRYTVYGWYDLIGKSETNSDGILETDYENYAIMYSC